MNYDKEDSYIKDNNVLSTPNPGSQFTGVIPPILQMQTLKLRAVTPLFKKMTSGSGWVRSRSFVKT